MNNRHRTFALVGLVTAVHFVVAFANGTEVSARVFLNSGVVASVVAASLFAFNRWVWSWGPLYPWLVETPNIRGCWRVEAEFSFGGTSADANRVNSGSAEVRQTRTSIWIRVDWDDGSGTTFLGPAPSVTSSEYTTFAGRYKMTYPDSASETERSHASFFTTGDRRPERIRIHFTTNDEHTGKLVMTSRE